MWGRIFIESIERKPAGFHTDPDLAGAKLPDPAGTAGLPIFNGKVPKIHVGKVHVCKERIM